MPCQHENCNTTVFRGDLDDHMSKYCVYRTLHCRHCTDDYIYINKKVWHCSLSHNFERKKQKFCRGIFVDLIIETFDIGTRQSLKELLVLLLQESFTLPMELKNGFKYFNQIFLVPRKTLPAVNFIWEKERNKLSDLVIFCGVLSHLAKHQGMDGDNAEVFNATTWETSRYYWNNYNTCHISLHSPCWNLKMVPQYWSLAVLQISHLPFLLSQCVNKSVVWRNKQFLKFLP